MGEIISSVLPLGPLCLGVCTYTCYEKSAEISSFLFEIFYFQSEQNSFHAIATTRQRKGAFYRYDSYFSGRELAFKLKCKGGGLNKGKTLLNY